MLQTGRASLQKGRKKFLLSLSLTFSFSNYTPHNESEVECGKKNSSQNHFETKRGNKERSNLIQVTLNAALKKNK